MHAESEHGLRVQLATALTDVAAFKASYARKLEDEKRALETASALQSERDALRWENLRLRTALTDLLHEDGPSRQSWDRARAALAGGGDRG